MSNAKKIHKAITEIDVLSPPKQCVEKILQAICDNLGYRFGTVIAVDNQGKGGMFASYNLPEDYSQKVNQVKAPVLSSPSGEAIETGRVVVVHNPLSDPRIAPWYEVIRPYNLETIVWVPLLSKDHVFGTFVLYDTQIRDISETELQMLEQIGVMVSIAISSNQNLNQLSQKTKEFEEEITERKRAEEELREREERKDLMLRTMPSALFTVDLNRRITSWNKEAEDITGLKAEEVIGKDCITAINCDACKKGCNLFDDNIDKPIYGKECTLDINGKLLTISKNADIFRDSQGNVLGGLESFIDITERKKMEDALQENEKLMNNILSAIPIGIGVVEIGTGGVEDRKLGWANETMMKMFGFEPNEDYYIGQSARVIYASEEEYKRAYGILRKNLEKGKIAEVDVKLKRKDGSIFDGYITISYIDPSNPMKGAIATISDISWRKQAEEELKKKNEELNRFNKQAVGRELKMIELKKEINALLEELGKEPRYKVVINYKGV